MAPSDEIKRIADALVAYENTLDQLQREIDHLPLNARNPLSRDHGDLYTTRRNLEARVNQLRIEFAAAPSRFSVVERLNRFIKARSTVKKLDESVEELGTFVGRLHLGIRISQEATLRRNVEGVSEETERLKEAMVLDPEDEAVIIGNNTTRHTGFIPDFGALALHNSSRKVMQGNASTPNFASFADFRGTPQAMGGLTPPPHRTLGMARPQSQNPYGFAASTSNLDQDFALLGANDVDGSRSALPQQDLATAGGHSAPVQPTRRMGHRHGPSLGAFNNRLSSYQRSTHSSQNDSTGSIGPSSAPRIVRRHSTSSGHSYSSFDPNLYSSSSRSGHSGNQSPYTGSMYADSSLGRSSLSIARSPSQNNSTGSH